MTRAARWTAGLALGLAALVPSVRMLRAEPELPCPAQGVLIVVDTGTRRLWRCTEGRGTEPTPVSLGSGGVGKRAEGDRKTPLGTYPLGAPRKSGAYRRFIPVGYPTAAQREAGHTGGAIGVHGPKRGTRWLGRVSALADWTKGCVAVPSDAAIDALSAWVTAHGVESIELR